MDMTYIDRYDRYILGILLLIQDFVLYQSLLYTSILSSFIHQIMYMQLNLLE